ncbi:MAG: alpha/beta fold hydrolase [Polyangiales bacterium]
MKPARRWGNGSRLITSCLLLGLVAGGLVGCKNFRRLRADLKETENMASVSGRVTTGDWEGGAIDVYLFDVEPSVGKPVRVSQVVRLEEPGKYRFSVRQGLYMIAAHEDANENERLDPGEPHALYEDFEILDVKAKSNRSRLNMELSTVRAPALDRISVQVPEKIEMRMGEVARLEDPRFDPSTGPMGMWTPRKFYDTYGAGVFMLQAYDKEKTPVLFIHGMSGHPREFTALIESLDPELYQPWVFQYPSGARLQNVVDALRRVLESMHAKQKFDDLCLVAHSMGGLVAHQLVRDQVDAGTKRYVRFLATISSPLGGIPSADTGVKMAPEVVPSWRDVGPKSQFVRSLFERPFPSDVSYALYFGFGHSSKDKKHGTDGVVTVPSALPRPPQDAAKVVSGFAESHTGILVNQATVKQLNEDLSALCLAED